MSIDFENLCSLSNYSLEEILELIKNFQTKYFKSHTNLFVVTIHFCTENGVVDKSEYYLYNSYMKAAVKSRMYEYSNNVAVEMIAFSATQRSRVCNKYYDSVGFSSYAHAVPTEYENQLIFYARNLKDVDKIELDID